MEILPSNFFGDYNLDQLCKSPLNILWVKQAQLGSLMKNYFFAHLCEEGMKMHLDTIHGIREFNFGEGSRTSLYRYLKVLTVIT